MTSFALDRRLEADSIFMTALGLCQMRLMNDKRWPWLLLVPQRPSVSEIFELTPLDQTMLTFEMGIAAKAVKDATGCLKINVAALGNQVRQLHIHVIARNEGDPAWPRPVWGVDGGEPYEKDEAERLVAGILGKL
jgi:diadenosine tetraphosphate (Ap4A) HIT family hydrolase